MMSRKIFVLTKFAIALLVICASSPGLQAAVRTWTGGGTTINWSDAANWQGNVVPLAGDDLVFPSGVTQLATNNNISARQFKSISFKGSGYSVSGLALRLSGNINAESANSNHLIDVPVQLTGIATCFISVGTDSH